MAEIKTTDVIDSAGLTTELQKIIDKFNELLGTMKKTSGEFQKASGSTKKLTEAEKQSSEEKKKQIAAEKELVAEQKRLATQRNKEIAAIQKQQQKQQEIIRAANMEVKSDADLNAKLKAQIQLREQINRKTEAGAKKYAEMTGSINKLKTQQIEANKSIQKFGDNVGNYPKHGANIAAIGAGFLAVAASAKQVYAAVKESIDLFVEQEKQSFRVQQAFGSYASVINQAADANQALTTVGNEQYQKLAVLAKSYGAANRDVNSVVEKSIGLSTQFEAAGIGQEQAMKMLIRAQNGDYLSLKRVIPAIAEAKNQQEAMTIINEAAAKGFDVAQKYAETYGGRMMQLKNITGDLKEEVGGQLLSGLFSTADGGKAVGAINDVIVALNKSKIIAKYMENVRDIAAMMFEPIDKIVKAFGGASDSGEVLQMIFAGLAKYMEIMMIPTRMIWAGISNIVDIIIGLVNIAKDLKNFKIQDIFNIINNAVSNLLTPITDLVGVTDDLNRILGVASDTAKSTGEALAKLQDTMSDPAGAGKKYHDEQIAIMEAEAGATKETEEHEEAVKNAQEAYKSYTQALAKANEEAILSIALGENELLVKAKQLQSIYDATKAYYELNGYTQAEIDSLKKLKQEIAAVNSELDLIKWDLDISKSIKEDMQNAVKDLTTIKPIDTEITFKAEIPEEEVEDLSKKFTLTFSEKLKKSFKMNKSISDALKSFFGDESVKTTADEVVNMMGTIADAADTLFDRQISKLDEVAEKNAKYYDDLMKNYEQDSAEYAQLQAQKEQKDREYQIKLIALERKKAAFDKTKALIDIAIATAVNIVKLIADSPYAALAVGIAGGVQAGVVASQPLPQYYVGLDSAKTDHTGIVADRGPEIVDYPDGTSRLFTSKTVTFLPKYTSVSTADETVKRLSAMQSTANFTEFNDNSRKQLGYLGQIARNTSKQSAKDLYYIQHYVK